MTGLTVVDDLVSENSPSTSSDRGEVSDRGLLSTDDIETALLRLIKDDPFATISELKEDLRRLPQFADVGWWRVFRILRRHHLLTRHARFRFARGRR